jgi:hypothetical protein
MRTNVFFRRCAVLRFKKHRLDSPCWSASRNTAKYVRTPRPSALKSRHHSWPTSTVLYRKRPSMTPWLRLLRGKPKEVNSTDMGVIFLRRALKQSCLKIDVLLCLCNMEPSCIDVRSTKPLKRVYASSYVCAPEWRRIESLRKVYHVPNRDHQRAIFSRATGKLKTIEKATC